VLRWPFQQTAQYRQQQLAELRVQLTNLHTPQPVIEAVFKGFQDWVETPSGRSNYVSAA
jgi:hypothetical protein